MGKIGHTTVGGITYVERILNYGDFEMKNRSINLLIVSLLLIAAMAVTLIVFLEKAKEDFPKNITVDGDGVTESILPVRDLSLNPTESKEYSVNLVCAASGTYVITLDYVEKVDGGMKSFVDVSVTCGDLLLYSGSLSDLLDTDTVLEMEGELKADDPLTLTFRYEMPKSVGNEAQGTYSDFDIDLKITKA